MFLDDSPFRTLRAQSRVENPRGLAPSFWDLYWQIDTVQKRREHLSGMAITQVTVNADRIVLQSLLKCSSLWIQLNTRPDCLVRHNRGACIGTDAPILESRETIPNDNYNLSRLWTTGSSYRTLGDTAIFCMHAIRDQSGR